MLVTVFLSQTVHICLADFTGRMYFLIFPHCVWPGFKTEYSKSFNCSEKFGDAKRAKKEESLFRRAPSQRNRKVPEKLKESLNMASDCVTVGRKVMVLWTEKELKGTTFKLGWYEGEIQWCDKDNDTVGILYREDVRRGKKAVYELCLTLAMADGIFKLKS